MPLSVVRYLEKWFSMVTFLPTIALFCQTWIGTHDMSQQQKHVIWREYVSHSCFCCSEFLVWFVYIGFSKPYSKLNSSHITTKWSILAHMYHSSLMNHQSSVITGYQLDIDKWPIIHSEALQMNNKKPNTLNSRLPNEWNVLNVLAIKQ